MGRSKSQTHAPSSPAELLASQPERKRQRFLESLSDEETGALLYHWDFWARDNQLPPPGDWRFWLIQAGRGFGKTRTATEWLLGRIRNKKARRIALLARTAADVRDTVVEGVSGLVTISPPWDRPRYEPTKRRLTWKNGAIATCFTADSPELLRGPEHDCALVDELASQNPRAWDNLLLGLRGGDDPRACIATTPKPSRLIRDLRSDPDCVITGGSTYENISNLAPAFIKQVIRKFEGTTIGLQELFGKLLEQTPGALWTRQIIDQHRVQECPDLVRIVVGVDPSVTSKETSAECGIVIGGISDEGHGYILEDLSIRASPNTWANRAVGAYRRWNADRIIGEVNNGGDLVEATIRTVDPDVSYKAVHASRGKYARAEPIAAMYEQGKIHHVGVFEDLEDQMCNYVPGDTAESPDRMDGAVWTLTELMEGETLLAGPGVTDGISAHRA